ncbi:MAG: hypothetical protein L0228_10055 [Planctomycetes bacterium]|nr:hypothetical protein [Planctomycetota bacterium]
MSAPWTRRVPRITERPTALPPQASDQALFRITGGKILVHSIVGEVTTAIGAVANATKIKHNPSGVGADVDLCATLDITGDPVGQIYTIVGVLATALKSTTLWLAVPADNIPAPGLLLGPGDIELDCAGSSVTGAIKWTVVWTPVDAGANLAFA